MGLKVTLGLVGGLVATIAVAAATVFFLNYQSFQSSALAGEQRGALTDPVVSEPTASAEVAAGEIWLASTGDVMLGRSVNYLGWKKHDYAWSWQEVAGPLAEFDFVVANLETPIITDCPLTNEGMRFCAGSESARTLGDSGPFDLLTLANNHIYNHGSEGLVETQQLLDESGVANVAAGEFFQTEVGGLRLGFLTWDDTGADLDEAAYTSEIFRRSGQVDHLIVALHFGAEYRYQPLERQRRLAHLAIDNGARLVLGNHSHWLGPIEKYGLGAIIYSHGNLIFDQMWSEETKQGLVVAWHLVGDRLAGARVYPVYITDYGRAHWVAGTREGERVMEIFERESSPAGTLTAGGYREYAW